MPLTKQYLRYSQTAVFNVVAGPRPNLVLLDRYGQRGGHAAVGGCERVFVWDLKKAEKTLELIPEDQCADTSNVTALAVSSTQQHLVAGYEKGDVVVFDLSGNTSHVTFRGHKSAVTALTLDPSGTKVISGSKDTNLIVWDVVNESGLFRLKGHKGMVTKVYCCTQENVLISSSKDTFIKFWDLDTQHCFKTLVGHRSEIWSFVVLKNDSCLITGTSESELKVWDITWHPQEEEPATKKVLLVSEDAEEGEDNRVLICEKRGSLTCRIKNRVVNVVVDASERILGVHGTDNYLELFYISTEHDLNKTLKRRKKKCKRTVADREVDENIVLGLEDEFIKMGRIKFNGKLCSFEVRVDWQHSSAKVTALLANNSLRSATFEVKRPNKNDVQYVVATESLPGHPSDVRTVSFSSDNTCCLSAGGEQVRVWNRASVQCIRTLPCEYALCSFFTPGDRHIIVGTKTGKLQLFDLASSSLLETTDAHSGAIWSLSVLPNKRGFVSGSADQEIKFWEFEIKRDDALKTSVMSINHVRTLNVSEDVLSVNVTSNHRLLSVSLLDNTMKVFFVDTLKLFLSLYGHKLPVLCLDTSDDNTILASGSADRNIKIWGLDFGDCRKSLFAHDDSVMCLKFVPKTHMFVSGGKDGSLKYWDGDTFQLIMKLQGHLAEVWCLAISPNGKHILSSSHDKSLRLWHKTAEPLILEEERETEREKALETEQLTETVVAGETNTETGLAAKKTPETLVATDRIIDALEIYKEEAALLLQHKLECEESGKEVPLPPANPLLLAYKADTPSKYVFEMYRRIKASEMEKALLLLPFSYACDLLELLIEWVKAGWDLDSSVKSLLFLLRIYHGQLTMNSDLLHLVDDIRSNTVQKVREHKDIIGFNKMGLQFLKQKLEEKEEAVLFKDATSKYKSRKKRKKSNRAAVLAIN